MKRRTLNLVSPNQVQNLIAMAVLEAGSQKAFAIAANISQQYVSDILDGRRNPGEKVLNYLGLEKVIYYRAKAVQE